MKYTLLGTSGLRVSELCLGTMTFGNEWAIGADRETSKGVFDAFTSAGGNFIDTANRYTNGTSEKWVGEFISHDRDHFVVATKYTLSDREGDVNFAGNHRKNLMRSLRDSLQRLQTDYVDVLWLHAWDYTTPADEILRALDDVISQGMVHYIGISDTPAWVVSHANTLAELRGWNKFVALQIEYSLLQRTPERDLLPMALQFGLSVTPWGALGGGALTGKYRRGEEGRVPEHSPRRSERANDIAAVVTEVAEQLGVPASAVALAWSRQRANHIVPIVGARRAEQLEDSLKAIDIVLPHDAIEKLESVSAIELGFPHDFLASEGVHAAMGNSLHKITNRRM